MATKKGEANERPNGQVFRMANSRVNLSEFREAWGTLTARQQMAVEMTCSGDTRDEIAEKLYISEHSVKSMITRAIAKLRPSIHGASKQSGVMDVVCWAHGYQAALYALQERVKKR